MKKTSKQAKHENPNQRNHIRSTKRLSRKSKLHVPRRTDDSGRVPAAKDDGYAKLFNTLAGGRKKRKAPVVQVYPPDTAKTVARIGRAVDQRKQATARVYRAGDVNGAPIVSVTSCAGCGRLPRVKKTEGRLVLDMVHARGCSIAKEEKARGR